MVHFSSRKQTLFVKHGKNVLSEFNKVNADSMSPYKRFCFSFSTAQCQKAQYKSFFLWMLFKPVLFGENDLSSVMNYEWLVAV